MALFTHAMLALSDVPPCTDRHEAVEAVLKVLLCKRAIEDRLLETAVLSDQGSDAMDAVLVVGCHYRLEVELRASFFTDALMESTLFPHRPAWSGKASGC